MATSISRKLSVIVTAVTKAYEQAMAAAGRTTQSFKAGVNSLSDTIVRAKVNSARNTPAIVNEAAKSGEQMAKATGKGFYSQWLKETNSMYGRRSDFGKTMKLLAGGGVIAGFAMAAKAVEGFTHSLVELKNGTKGLDDVLKSIPIFGTGWSVGRDLRELITSEEAIAAAAKLHAEHSQKAADAVHDIVLYTRELQQQTAGDSRSLLDQLVGDWTDEQTQKIYRLRQAAADARQEVTKAGEEQKNKFREKQNPLGQELIDSLQTSIDNNDPRMTLLRKIDAVKTWQDQYNAGLQAIDSATEKRKREAGGISNLKEAATNIKTAWEGWGRIVSNIKAGIASKYDQFAKEAEKAQGDAAKAAEKANQEQQRQAEAQAKALADAGRQVYEQTRTPLERFQAQADELRDLLNQGQIDWDTYGRAVKQAMGELDTGKQASIRRPDLMLAGSAAAQRLAYENSSGYRAMNQDKQLEAQKKANDYLKRIEGNTRQNQPQVVTI